MADNQEILQAPEVVTTDETVSQPSPKKQKFITKDVIKCVVVLAAIALVAGVLLGVMNWLTYVDPDEMIMKDVSAFYGTSIENVSKDETRAISDGGKSYIEACYVTKDGEAVKGYCYYSIGAGAKGGTIGMLVYIGTDGVIQEIDVYEQAETAGYFKKVNNANHDKYVGLDVDDIDNVVLLGSKHKGALTDGEVTAVGGATYTSTGYHNAISAAVYAYKNYKEA